MKNFYRTLSITLTLIFSIVVIGSSEPKPYKVEKNGVTYDCKPELATKPKQVVKSKPKVAPKPIPKIAPVPEIPPAAPARMVETIRYNTIFLEPMVYFMHEASTRRLVGAPGLGLSYVRRCTPAFSFGFGVSYAHAFYGAFPDRTFNMYGGKLMFGFNF